MFRVFCICVPLFLRGFNFPAAKRRERNLSLPKWSHIPETLTGGWEFRPTATSPRGVPDLKPCSCNDSSPNQLLEARTRLLHSFVPTVHPSTLVTTSPRLTSPSLALFSLDLFQDFTSFLPTIFHQRCSPFFFPPSQRTCTIHIPSAE